MKYLKKHSISLFAAAILLVLPVLASVASAQTDLNPFFIMSPGSVQEDNFYVNDIFNSEELGPIAPIIVAAVGETSGTLTITITPKDASKSFTYKNSYMLVGFSYALDGTPAPVIASKSYPLAIVQKIPVNSSFGFAALGLIVTSVSNLDPADVIPPFKFTIKIELSVAEPAAEK